MKKFSILVTGSAGFIGYHLVKDLLSEGHEVIGIDNLNDYYDQTLKNARLKDLDKRYAENMISKYQFFKVDICDEEKLNKIFKKNKIEIVINLAAQAGVRYSIKNPKAYIQSNLVGFSNILECCRNFNVKHLIYASSSSVYGMNSKQPFSSDDNTDFPISLYAATKKSNELLAFSYSHLFKIPSTGLRFFTVYGPFGRPDMAYFKFVDAINKNKEIDVYNHGKMKRDFTYVDDINEMIIKLIDKVPPILRSKTSNAEAPYVVYNIGNNNPVSLEHFISVIEEGLSKKAKKNFLPMQPGDVPITYADIDPLIDTLKISPKTSIEKGLKSFIDWYTVYYEWKIQH